MLHRLLGRVIGLAFAAPLALVRGASGRSRPATAAARSRCWRSAGCRARSAGGWSPRACRVRTDVSHIRLAVHLTDRAGHPRRHRLDRARPAAAAPQSARAPARLTARRSRSSRWRCCSLQIVFGAFTAGLDAGYAFSSWPLMGDALFPAGAPMPAPAGATRSTTRSSSSSSTAGSRSPPPPALRLAGARADRRPRRARRRRAGRAPDRARHRHAADRRADRHRGRASGQRRAAADRHGRRRACDRPRPPCKRRGILIPVSKPADCLTFARPRQHWPAHRAAPHRGGAFRFERSTPMKALMKTTKSAKPHEVEKKWHIVDADGPGRRPRRGGHRQRPARQAQDVASPRTSIAATTSSSSTPTRSASPATRRTKKIYYKHTGYAGGIKGITAAKVLEGRFPERVLEKAVERMIPRGPLGREQMRNLRIFAGTRASARRAEPRSPRHRRHEPQEQGGRIMSDNRQSLSDLAA